MKRSCNCKKERATRCMCDCANNQVWVWTCVCVSGNFTPLSSRQLLVSICKGPPARTSKLNRRLAYAKLMGVYRLQVSIFLASVLSEDEDLLSFFYCFVHKIQQTRKRALHARMSHSTVCYTTVCTKKTLRILVK